jgi:hypothetical protein
LETYDSSWKPINATVNITDIIYHGSAGTWVNTPIDFGKNEAWNGNVTVNGYGEITIPGGNLSIITKSGEYEIVLNATYQGTSQLTRTWFRATSFVMVSIKDREGWDEFYSPGEIVNITIKAGKRYNYTSWPLDVEEL